ncbi:uncharacterized protein LOC131216701 [Anopheles bellator]|uniref:uncharacterized protein LOC131216701 n=1 Tax=Anopheles bellator TaxID=139047 RepID=UPI0026477E5D|nr:uncharacterized protein LOC131216701 [Anopheles bellator]
MWKKARAHTEPSQFGTILLLAVGLLGKVSATGAASTGSRDQLLSSPAQTYFDAVAPEDRENFIKFHLDKALGERLPYYTPGTGKDFEFSSTYQDAMEPEDFSVNLLGHFMGTFGLTETDVIQFVTRNVICFPSGWCFNPDDIGNICCPF